MQKTRRILFWINPNLHQHLHRNLTPPRLGYKWLTYKHGRRNSEGFFQSVAKRFFFQGLATVVKFNFINSETKSKAFFCWNVISKMSNFEMNGVPWHPPFFSSSNVRAYRTVAAQLRCRMETTVHRKAEQTYTTDKRCIQWSKKHKVLVLMRRPACRIHVIAMFSEVWKKSFSVKRE